MNSFSHEIKFLLCVFFFRSRANRFRITKSDDFNSRSTTNFGNNTKQSKLFLMHTRLEKNYRPCFFLCVILNAFNQRPHRFKWCIAMWEGAKSHEQYSTIWHNRIYIDFTFKENEEEKKPVNSSSRQIQFWCNRRWVALDWLH